MSINIFNDHQDISGQIHIMKFKDKILVLYMDREACAELAAGNDDALVTGFCAQTGGGEIENTVIALKDGEPVAVRVVEG